MVVAMWLAGVVASQGQQVGPNKRATGTQPAPTASAANADRQREQIWNSPNMLRARAWLQDYCSKSAKITPEQGKKYMDELANMTPSQMELWLLKFDHEEQQRQQQYSLWSQAHAAGLSRAMAANQVTQQAYAAINRGENEAAGEEQQQLEEQKQFSQSMTEGKTLEEVGPYGPLSYPGYGGIHYHYHLYPYPY